MPEESTEDEDEDDGIQEGGRGDRTSSESASPYSRLGKDKDIASWLASKEEKRLKGISKASSGKGLRRTRLNPVSKKQKKRNASYEQSKKEFLEKESNQKCYLCGKTSSLSIHHRDKRGDNLDNPLLFLTLCMIGDYMDKEYPDSNHSHSGGCHGWAEGNKETAREMKLIV